jgi:hypothetical protein
MYSSLVIFEKLNNVFDTRENACSLISVNFTSVDISIIIGVAESQTNATVLFYVFSELPKKEIMHFRSTVFKNQSLKILFFSILTLLATMIILY